MAASVRRLVTLGNLAPSTAFFSWQYQTHEFKILSDFRITYVVYMSTKPVVLGRSMLRVGGDLPTSLVRASCGQAREFMACRIEVGNATLRVRVYIEAVMTFEISAMSDIIHRQ